MRELNPGLSVAVEPAAEPLTLAKARLFLKVDEDVTEDDSLITDQIKEARQAGENETGRAWITQTLRLVLDRWPEAGDPGQEQGSTIWLPRPPLVSVTSVQYYDVDGALQTLAASKYWVVPHRHEGRLVLKSTESWPELEEDRPAAILVDFVAGFGGASNVPGQYLSGLKLLLGHLYENRTHEVTGTIISKLGLSVDTLWNHERVIPL